MGKGHGDSWGGGSGHLQDAQGLTVLVLSFSVHGHWLLLSVGQKPVSEQR